eukprot:3763677-Rhodomonas_salina.1
MWVIRLLWSRFWHASSSLETESGNPVRSLRPASVSTREMRDRGSERRARGPRESEPDDLRKGILESPPINHASCWTPARGLGCCMRGWVRRP